MERASKGINMTYINKYPIEENIYETMLSKFGSRLVLIPQPKRKIMAHGLMGFYYDKPVETTIAVNYKGLTRSLPFSTKFKTFEFMKQEIGLTYITYHCSSNEIPFEVVFTICAPFYPQDIKLSVAPFFYFIIKRFDILKTSVYGSKSNITNRIQFSHLIHNHFTNNLRIYFTFTGST